MIHYRKKTLILKSKKHRIKYDKLLLHFGEKNTFLVLKIIFNDYSPDYLKSALPKRMGKDSKFEWVLEKLKTSGIKTVTYYEDFVDEDTFEVVSIKRSRFKIWNDKKKLSA